LPLFYWLYQLEFKMAISPTTYPAESDRREFGTADSAVSSDEMGQIRPQRQFYAQRSIGTSQLPDLRWRSASGQYHLCADWLCASPEQWILKRAAANGSMSKRNIGRAEGIGNEYAPPVSARSI